ncbi:hypothetical protein FD755_025559, partial [Muntiacus reevesi]
RKENKISWEQVYWSSFQGLFSEVQKQRLWHFQSPWTWNISELGTTSVWFSIRKLALFDEWNSLAVYVSMDNTVVIEDIKKMCRTLSLSADIPAERPLESLTASTQSKGPSACCTAWKPLLLIVPLRLGINQINPVYVDAFKECFKMPQSLGALGGKPNNAYYFIGFLESQFFQSQAPFMENRADPQLTMLSPHSKALIRFLGQVDPLEEEMTTHSNILSMGSQSRTRLSTHTDHYIVYDI